MRRVNVEGLIHATRAVIGGMRARRYGRIVNISSIAAIGTAFRGNAFYAATKAEVAILTKRFALELGPDNITVNAVAPGFVRTDMTQRGRGAGDWQGTEESFAAKAMMGRIGEPEDIANAVAFLASPESGWITAQMFDRGRWTNGLHRTCLARIFSKSFRCCRNRYRWHRLRYERQRQRCKCGRNLTPLCIRGSSVPNMAGGRITRPWTVRFRCLCRHRRKLQSSDTRRQCRSNQRIDRLAILTVRDPENRNGDAMR
jgi:Enoyl-(Acyl carrier protein) reductase